MEDIVLELTVEVLGSFSYICFFLILLQACIVYLVIYQEVFLAAVQIFYWITLLVLHTSTAATDAIVGAILLLDNCWYIYSKDCHLAGYIDPQVGLFS